MSSPFPGMNPYLENRELWTEIQSRLIIAITEFLVPQLWPKYRVAIKKAVYQMTDDNSVIVGIPDVAVERSLTTTEKELSNIAVASPPTKPVIVNLPMLEEI